MARLVVEGREVPEPNLCDLEGVDAGYGNFCFRRVWHRKGCSIRQYVDGKKELYVIAYYDADPRYNATRYAWSEADAEKHASRIGVKA